MAELTSQGFVSPKCLDVTVDKGLLTISGERKAAAPTDAVATTEASQPPAPAQGMAVYTRERASGSFRRAVSLPEDADPSQVTATYRDGVLHISVARRQAAQPSRITVQ